MMKKVIIPTLIWAYLGISLPALAVGDPGNQDTLHFIGTVLTTTCDLIYSSPNSTPVFAGQDTPKLSDRPVPKRSQRLPRI